MKIKSLFLSNWIHLIGALIFYYFVSIRHLYLQKSLNESFDFFSFIEIIPTAFFSTIFGIIGYLWLIILLITVFIGIAEIILYCFLLKPLVKNEGKRFILTSASLILMLSISSVLIYQPILFAIPIFVIGEIIKYKKLSGNVLDSGNKKG